jgi:hypothetical protein
MATQFKKLNSDWNAEPNAPAPIVTVTDDRLVLEFYLNSFVYPRFGPDQRGGLRFSGVSRYRLGPTNDEGWYRGQCRFSKIAPAWGEFYEVSGDLLMANGPADWNVVNSKAPSGLRHFLFYLRDETFECEAEAWEFCESL